MIEVTPCPYDCSVEDADPHTVRRALRELEDCWEAAPFTSPAQLLAAASLMAGIRTVRALAQLPYLSAAEPAHMVLTSALLDTVECCRRTLVTVCRGRPA